MPRLSGRTSSTTAVSPQKQLAAIPIQRTASPIRKRVRDILISEPCKLLSICYICKYFNISIYCWSHDGTGGEKMPGQRNVIERWVEQISTLTNPDRIVYCDGSEEEGRQLIGECLKTGELIELNQQKLPGCYLHRSAPHDVARTEHLTFISTQTQGDAGPNNNWMSPADAGTKLVPLFRGAMKGRTMYVVPFLMGPPGSIFSKVGVEITDSKYVVLNMRIMTRVGTVALEHLGGAGEFTRCLHALNDLSPERRFICHFPEDNEVWSIGSGYG